MQLKTRLKKGREIKALLRAAGGGGGGGKSVWRRPTKLPPLVMWREETARHWDILRDSEGLGEALKDSEGFYVSRNILRRLGGFAKGGGRGG